MIPFALWLPTFPVAGNQLAKGLTFLGSETQVTHLFRTGVGIVS
jgi:hypothetical protein